MKKMISLLLACCLMLALTACGSNEPSEFTCTLQQDGSTTTMTFEAEGNVITKISQKSVFDITSYTEEQIAMINEKVAEISALYESVEGAEYSMEKTETEIIETVVIPMDEETLKQVIEKELLPVDTEGAEELSLEATKVNMELAGWVIEE